MKSNHAVFITIAVMYLSGCSTPPASTPTFMVNDVQTIRNINTITLLPIATSLEDTGGKSQKLSAILYKELAVELALKGYVLEKADSFSDRAEIPPSAVNNLGVERLALLGPADSKYLIICYLQDYDKTNVLVAKDTDMHLSAVLIDKRNKRVLWKNVGDGEVKTGAITGGLETGVLMNLFWNDDPEVIKQGLANLFFAFPDKDTY